MCDIIIAGLPTTLTGHIIPDLSIALLFGIQVLTEAGCDITFTKGDCIIKYNGNIILKGKKDPSTDLWTLPLGKYDMTSQHSHSILLSVPCCYRHPCPCSPNSMHSLHSPIIVQPLLISTLINWSYLKGYPNLTSHGITNTLTQAPLRLKDV